jgi:hypothetical protein
LWFDMAIESEASNFFSKAGLERSATTEDKWTEWYSDKGMVMVFRGRGVIGNILNSFEKPKDVPEVEKILAEHKSKDSQRVKVSLDLLKQVLNLMVKSSSDSVVFKVKNDYPLFLQTDDFECILAPRVEED